MELNLKGIERYKLSKVVYGGITMNEAIEEYLFINNNDWEGLFIIGENQKDISKINLDIQKEFNKGKVCYKSFNGTVLKEGSRVIQNVNNYDLNIFNGEIGYVQSVTSVDNIKYLNVSFGHKVVSYPEKDIKNLNLAYAISRYSTSNVVNCSRVLFLIDTNKDSIEKEVLDNMLEGVKSGLAEIFDINTKKSIVSF